MVAVHVGGSAAGQSWRDGIKRDVTAAIPGVARTRDGGIGVI